MLFHITAKHDHVTCTRKTDPSRRIFRQLLEGSGKGKTLGAWVDGPSHTIYAILETDSHEAIRDVCDGLMDMGPVDVRPVRDIADILKKA